MISKNPVEPTSASSSSDTQTPVLDPRSPIEVTPDNGTVNDPTAKDNRPPGVTGYDLDLLA
jgi:hypothetical protein